MPSLFGFGTNHSNPYNSCGGSGLHRKTVEIKIKVPSGVSAGNYMTLNQQGNKGLQGYQSGDLIILFEEEGTLFLIAMEKTITEAVLQFYDAAKGTTLEIPTLEGKAKLKIPAGIQSSQVLRMRGKGFPRMRGSSRGDRLVRIHVETLKISSKQSKLLEEFEKLNKNSEVVYRRINLD